MAARATLACVLLLLAACGGEGGTPDGQAGSGGGAGGDGGGGGGAGGTPFPLDSPPQAPALKEGVEAPVLASGKELLLFLNGRLTDAGTQFASHRIERHRIVGPEVFAYDPAQPGKLLLLGRADLGPIDAATYTGPSPRERQKLWSYDLAWDPELGLWAFHLERFNDEWLLGRWDLPSFTTPEQAFAIEMWALPEEPRGPSVLYWEDDIRALAFVGGTLWVGTSGDPAAGGTRGGQLYRLDVDLPPRYADLPPPNQNWYMDERPGGPVITLPDRVAFAGDLAEHAGALLGIGKEDGPQPVNFLLRLDPERGTAERAAEDIPVTPGQDVQALASIGGVLYGLAEDGRVLRIDPQSGAATPHDDLAPLFTDLAGQVWIGGGTRVVVP